MMNPPIFYGSYVKEDPQDIIDEIYNILYAMGLTTSEKGEWDTYQLKDMAQVWYVQWRNNRPLRDGPMTLMVLKRIFLIDSFL